MQHYTRTAGWMDFRGQHRRNWTCSPRRVADASSCTLIECLCTRHVYWEAFLEHLGVWPLRSNVEATRYNKRVCSIPYPSTLTSQNHHKTASKKLSAPRETVCALNAEPRRTFLSLLHLHSVHAHMRAHLSRWLFSLLTRQEETPRFHGSCN